MTKYVRKLVTIREDQEETIAAHPELNLSGAVQKMIDEMYRGIIEAVLPGLGGRRALYSSETEAKCHLGYVFPHIEWGEWIECNEPEASEHEEVMYGTEYGAVVVALYQ